MEQLTPNKKVQKAITPDFLRCMSSLSSTLVINDAEDHAIDLIIFAFFFAMRSCEYVSASPPGRTKTITLGCITFWTKDRRLIHHDDPHLYHIAVYVRVVFIDQKNGEKFEPRVQRRSGDPALCPVVRAARAVKRVRSFVPDYDDSTLLCATHGTSCHAPSLNQDFTLQLIRKVCTDFGGRDRFGFDKSEIGNRSIRCGAAMALFVTGHSSDKIMILGRWKSSSFMDYIRPQVIEWINHFSSDMISFDNFFELFVSKKTRRTESQRRCFEIPNLVRSYEEKSGRRWNSVSNREKGWNYRC